MVDNNNDGKDDVTGLDIQVIPPGAQNDPRNQNDIHSPGGQESDKPSQPVDDGPSLEDRVAALENALRGANLEGIGGSAL